MQADDILLLIKPFSELGRKEKKNFKQFNHGDEEKAIKYYHELTVMIDFFKNQSAIMENIIFTLSKFEDIRNIVKAGLKRTLQLHELYEVKNFLYQLNILVNYDQKKDQSKVDCSPFIKLDNINSQLRDIFFRLDIENQNLPSFFISTKYSQKYYEKKNELKKIFTEIQNLANLHNQKIAKELNLCKFEEVIVISRLQTELLEKLLSSDYFVMIDENFANITLKIKKTDEILNLEKILHDLNKDCEEEAEKIQTMLTKEILIKKEILLKAMDLIGEFDLIFAKAIFAKDYACTIPVILSDKKQNNTVIVQANNSFNIIQKNELEKLNINYQKIDIYIKKKINVLTGSNMGGKTSVLKIIGQLALLTKHGVPLPAEKVKIILFDNIFFSGVANQQDRIDLSTFGNEIYTLQEVINKSGQNLFLMDEFGRATNPAEGEALYHATLDYFSKKTSITLISATHFNPPKKLKNCDFFQLIGLKDNFHAENNLKNIFKYMNYQPVEAEKLPKTPKSALFIAEALGLEKEIIEKAKLNLSYGS